MQLVAVGTAIRAITKGNLHFPNFLAINPSSEEIRGPFQRVNVVICVQEFGVIVVSRKTCRLIDALLVLMQPVRGRHDTIVDLGTGPSLTDFHNINFSTFWPRNDRKVGSKCPKGRPESTRDIRDVDSGFNGPVQDFYLVLRVDTRRSKGFSVTVSRNLQSPVFHSGILRGVGLQFIVTPSATALIKSPPLWIRDPGSLKVVTPYFGLCPGECRHGGSCDKAC
mmetsp:Transcript_5647/g.10969  ORF Transcript_5647/g.10969 Transcript_5647/m.10969 type:complete len:223 (+) Transcript_5647:1414-2082(+)